jgi:hypothetical protein
MLYRRSAARSCVPTRTQIGHASPQVGSTVQIPMDKNYNNVVSQVRMGLRMFGFVRCHVFILEPRG